MISELIKAAIEQTSKKALFEQTSKSVTDASALPNEVRKAWGGELPKAEMQAAPQWEGQLPSKETRPSNWDGTLPGQEKMSEVPQVETQQNQIMEGTNQYKNLQSECKKYNKELKCYSAGGEIAPIKPQILTKRTPEELQDVRSHFNQYREEIIKTWESSNGEWPRYAENVYSDSGKLIRRAGDRYDAHHNTPLGLGGANTAENITPMHAKDHYDKQGIHRPGSPYDNIANIMKGG